MVRAALPAERGELSAAVLRFLRGRGGTLPPAIAVGDPLADDDLQLALYLCYELHYRGFHDVDDRLEWDPRSIAFRTSAEELIEEAIRSSVDRSPVAPGSVPELLRSMAPGSPDPWLATSPTRHLWTSSANS